MARRAILSLLFLGPLVAMAQEEPIVADTAAVEVSAITNSSAADTLDWRQRHSPRTASILSAVLPGAGQAYNRKYWKMPIVYAGLGTSVWFIRENQRQYRRYKDAYLALVDGDPTTVDEFDGRFAPEQVREVMETYQRWRDLSYIMLGVVYVLQIVDASVDAHFVRFDVSPGLGLSLGPALEPLAFGAPGLSVRLAFR